MRTKKTVALLQARIDQLEAQAAGVHEEHRSSRRGMLRLAGAAAFGGLAAAVTSQPAAATDNAEILAGVSVNTATLPTGIAVTQPAGAAYGLGCYEAALGALSTDLGRPAVFGHATGSAFTKGVAGHSTVAGGAGVYGLDDAVGNTGSGVRGKSASGTAVRGESFGVNGTGVRGDATGAAGTGVAGFCDGLSGGGVGALALGPIGLYGFGPGGALQLAPHEMAAPPSRLTPYASFTLETDENDGTGSLWYCYDGGTPGKWRKLAGPATAGAFHAIKPTRVYDSRAPLPASGILDSGLNRLVSVAAGRDNNGAVTNVNLVPAGATAVAANITVTGTTGGFGYLAINPGLDFVEGGSTINWFGAGQTLANGVTLTLNDNRQLQVICNGGGSTHFIIDISGYYL